MWPNASLGAFDNSNVDASASAVVLLAEIPHSLIEVRIVPMLSIKDFRSPPNADSVVGVIFG